MPSGGRVTTVEVSCEWAPPAAAPHPPGTARATPPC